MGIRLYFRSRASYRLGAPPGHTDTQHMCFHRFLMHLLWTHLQGLWTETHYWCRTILQLSLPIANVKANTFQVKSVRFCVRVPVSTKNPSHRQTVFEAIIWMIQIFMFFWNIQIMKKKKKRLNCLFVPSFSTHDRCRLKVIWIEIFFSPNHLQMFLFG